MKELNIKLKNMDDIVRFSSIMSEFDIEAYCANSKYVVDAQSLMGLFSLDLKSDIQLMLMSDDEKLTDTIENYISQFIIEQKQNEKDTNL